MFLPIVILCLWAVVYARYQSDHIVLPKAKKVNRRTCGAGNFAVAFGGARW